MALLKSGAAVLLGIFLTAVTLATGSLQSSSTISSASAQATPAELPPVDYSMYGAEMQKALRWLDALGYPSTGPGEMRPGWARVAI